MIDTKRERSFSEHQSALHLSQNLGIEKHGKLPFGTVVFLVFFPSSTCHDSCTGFGRIFEPGLICKLHIQ